MSHREFLFHYRFAGHEWGITVHAADPAEAKEKIKQVALARYQGEVTAKINVPGSGLISRMVAFCERFRRHQELRCQCEACRRDGPHASCCAVHNGPALPSGACDCGTTSDLANHGETT